MRILFALLLCAPALAQSATELWVDFAPAPDAARAQRIVFVTGDEEYRSEEGMPQLARILAERHGFPCRVLFAIDPQREEIDPNVRDNIPGLEALAQADLLVLFTRFRNLPDEQMQHIADYVDSGKPIVGLRTATHAFQIPSERAFARFDWRSEAWPGGFGKQVLGETWVAHWGAHGTQSTRGVPAPDVAEHPILRGIEPGSIWDPADVYEVRLPIDGEPLVLGQVLEGMTPDSPVAASKNDPPMPIAWTRTFAAKGGPARVFTTTLGSAQAFAHAGSRRLLVNACYWALGLESEIRADADVRIVGAFEPTPFGFGKARRGVTPASLGREEPREAPAPRFGARVLGDLEYADLDAKHTLDLYLPTTDAGQVLEPAPPLLVWIHGGGWTRGSKNRVPAALRDLVTAGYALASVGYRLSGIQSHPEHTHDCKGAIRWLRANAERFGYDATRIGVAGGSAGGHLALMLGMTAGIAELEGGIGGNLDESSRVQAVVDMFGPTDLTLYERSRARGEFAKRASPVSYVSADDAPVLILQGDADRTVPPKHSERLHEVYGEHQLESTLFVAPGAGHGARWFGEPECRAMIRAFFDLHVRGDTHARERLRAAVAVATAAAAKGR